MTSPSITLAAWTIAWLRGTGAPDNLLDALRRWAPQHLVVADDGVAADRTDTPFPHPEPDLAALLRVIRRAITEQPRSQVRLVLPVPGDVSGLPAHTRFARTAMAAGQGILLGAPDRAGFGLVPSWADQETLLWTIHRVPVIPAGEQVGSLGEAEYAIREAVRDAASAVTELALVSGSSTGARTAVAEALIQAALHTYPQSLPPRALRILESADHVDAILTAADTLGVSSGPMPGAVSTLAVDAATAVALETHLQPLRRAVRIARTSAINADGQIN